MFDGDTFDAGQDGQRLKTQLHRVRHLMADGSWRTLEEIRESLEAPYASVPAISARLRDLRKDKHGAWLVSSRRRNQGLWEYQVTKPAPAGQLELF